MKIQGTLSYILSEVRKAALDPTKIFICDIKEKREKRSLDANNYAWQLMDQIARHLRLLREELE